MKRPEACCEAVRRIATVDDMLEGYACPIHGTQWIPSLAIYAKVEKAKSSAGEQWGCTVMLVSVVLLFAWLAYLASRCS